MNLDSELTVRGLVVHAVDVPMNRPLKTGGGEVGSAAMVLIDLLTEEGVTGCGYLFCPTPLVLKPLAKLLSNLAPLIEGDLLAPVEIERKLQKTFRLLACLLTMRNFATGSTTAMKPLLWPSSWLQAPFLSAG